MTDANTLGNEQLCTTDGEIAVINLDSSRLRSWSRFFQNPLQPGTAEIVIEHEQLTAQFVGDVFALDRLESLAKQLVQLDPGSARTALVQAQVAATMHQFSDARHHLAQASIGGAPSAEARRLQLSIDQACGIALDAVLDERSRLAKQSGRLEDLVALGALLADLREFTEADRAYRQGLRQYRDVSPFAPAWVCFQLGVLWGELMPVHQTAQAAYWYRKALEHLPRYTKARVHLAEIYSAWDRLHDAEVLLEPALSSGDPEVHWRLADVMTAQGRSTEADARMQAAKSGFEVILSRHLLAFADHGAEFYAGSGGDLARAFELARINVANRPTLRAFEQAYGIAQAANDEAAATELRTKATKRWGGTAAFHSSPLAMETTAVAGSEHRLAYNPAQQRQETHART
jgi:tetratricopeptide (TPR) repeat protein